MDANKPFIFLFGLVLYISIASATDPTISFIPPTPDNNSINTTLSININTTHTSPDGVNTTAWIDYGLMGCWHMNEAAGGTNVEDCSIYKNNGTWNGNTTSNVTTGNFGNSLQFDSINDFVRIGNTTSLNFSGVGSMSVSAWVYPKVSTGTLGILNRHSDINNAQGTLRIASGNLQYIIRTSDTGFSVGTSSGIINTNKWSHVVFNWNGTSATFYINGSLDPNIYSVVGLIESTTPVSSTTIGATTLVAEVFNGSIDEVKIYNRALSEDEIKASYNASAYRLNTTISNLLVGTTINYTAYIQDIYGNITSTETRYVQIKLTDQADYIQSTCRSTISWWNVGIAMTLVLIIAFGGFVAIGFMTGNAKLEPDDLIYYMFSFILFLVIGTIGLSIALPILNIAGCS